MTLEDFYFLSQIAAALGIIASLIFVGLQVRQSNAQAKADAAETTHRAMIEWYYHQTSETAAIMSKVAQADKDLTDAERYQYLSVTMPLLMNMQEAHAKWVDGSLDDSRWEFWDAFASLLSLRSVADEVWELRKSLFTQRFRDYMQAKFDAREPEDVSGTWQATTKTGELHRCQAQEPDA